MMQEGGLDCVTGLGKYKGRLIILIDVDKGLSPREPGSESFAIAAAGNGDTGQSASAGSRAARGP